MSNPATPPTKVKSYDWASIARNYIAQMPDEVVYPFARGRNFIDSRPGNAFYSLVSFVGSEFADLIANNATLTKEPFDGILHSLKIVDAGANAGAHVAFETERGEKYQIDFRYHNNNDGSNHSLRVYDGDQTGFGASEPTSIGTTGALGAVTDWDSGTLTFTALSATTTLAIWNEDAGAGAGYYHDVKYKRIAQ